MADQKLYEHIANYLNNLLSKEEQEAFEQQIKTDSALKQELELHRSIQSQLSKKEDISNLKRIITDVTSQARSRNRKKWLGGLLLIICLAMAAWYVYFREQPKIDEQRIFASYYEKYPSYPVLRNEQDSSLFRQGLIAYSEEDYSTAIRLLEFKTTRDNKGILPFYLAMSYLENAQFDEAEKELTYLDEQTNSEFAEATTWYRALLLLRRQELDSAEILLKKLQSSTGKYEVLSKEILIKIQ